MVVAASFMCNVVVDGIIFSCGMLLPLFKEEFGVSNSEVSWVSSLLGGFYLIVGEEYLTCRFCVTDIYRTFVIQMYDNNFAPECNMAA